MASLRPLALLLALVLAARARATTLVPMSDETLVRTSDLIALGDVRRIETRELADRRIVTEVTVLVLRTVKGRLRNGKLVVTVPGGQMGDRLVHVFGAPEFSVGERVVVFLKRTPEGRLRTNALALGKYHVDSSSGGGLVARRAVPTPDVRDLDRFIAGLAALVPPGAQQLVPSGRSGVVARTAPYTFLGSPPSRWFETNVNLRLANFDPVFGAPQTQAIIDGAMAAWNNVPSATIVLGTGTPTSTAPSIAGGTCDGVSTIQFGDPYSEVADLSNCSGVLAVGGFCVSGETTVVGGITFRRIVEGDVTVNNGVATCFGATNTAEVLTHEIGHTIGLGHSSQNQNEPNPTLEDATMFYLAHFDGRGAAVRSDDVSGVSAIYPATDGDSDGVPDSADQCPATAYGLAVDATGCACADSGHVSCDDGNVCTTDACNASTGSCTHVAVSCPDSDPCTLDGCVPASGCYHTPTGDLNNDGVCDGAEDNDGDGVVTALDDCWTTPPGLAVDAHGCACGEAQHVSCDDGNPCTDDTCDVATAACTHSDPTCDDGDPCTDDACDLVTGCTHVAGADADGDGVCDSQDDCPRVPDADQADADGDGVGDSCECHDSRPGRCIPAQTPPSQRCSVEWRPVDAPAPRRGLPPATLRCTDGDPACDADDVSGQCTFRMLVCINNDDPRFHGCVPYRTSSLQVLAPNGRHPRDAVDGANAAALAAAIDLDAQAIDYCSAPVRLVVPVHGRKPGSRAFTLRARTTTGAGRARLKLICAGR